MSQDSTKFNILVTGADGFIGSHLVEELVRQGHNVRAFVMYNSFNSWGWLDSCAPDVKGKFEVIAGDIRDPNGVFDAVKGCSVIFHLAALIAIPFSYRSPDSYVDTNIRGTLNVLQAARKLNVEKVIHTSTSEVYGSAQFVPITEMHPLVGQSPYSASKIGADQLALSFFTSFELPVVTIRPFNTYGPRQSARAVIPTIITQLLSENNEVQVGNINATRDFSYVADTVSGFIAAMHSHDCAGETINLGTGFEVSIEKLIESISQTLKISKPLAFDSERIRPKLSEVDRLCSDNSKAKKMLNWTPRYSGIDGLLEGLALTSDWFSKPTNLANYKTSDYNV
jgi:dTDP-glucose 4,6-dehydratase